MHDLPEKEFDVAQSDRRKFVTRNLLAIGVIAASAFTGTSANAKCRGNPMMRRACSVDDAKCFLKGTKILTVSGERNVEDLVEGDELPTMFGGTRRVEAVARYAYDRKGKSWAHHERPVRICASAIAPGVPHRDLVVSHWHALYVDGALIPAGNLVNGKSILLDAAEEVTTLEFFHVRLEKHDVIYAEGMPCESLLLDSETQVDVNAARETDEACAPFLYYQGRKGQIASRVRSAVSPWIDRRWELDIIRDRIEARVS